MGALRKDRLLKEALGEQEGDMPTAEGILTLASIVFALLAVVLLAG